MKLRNYLYATMVACAFASCSNDDDIINGGDDLQGDATLSLKIALPETKAIGTGADNVMNPLTVYVFNGVTDNLEISKAVTTGSEVTEIKVSGGTKKVLVLANVTPTATTCKGVLDEMQANYNNEVNGELSMNSNVYTVDIVPGKGNYLGYATVPAGGNNLNTAVGLDGTVKMYRNVAKAVLKSVKLDASAVKYPNAELTLKRAFILHGAASTQIVGQLRIDANYEWGATAVAATNYINGVSDGEYAEWVSKMNNQIGIKKYFTAQESSKYSIYTRTDKVNNYVGSLSEELVNGATYPTEAGTVVDQFYVYENQNVGADKTETLLVLEAAFNYEGIDPITRYYTVAVANDDVKTVNNKTLNGITRTEDGILRNMQYNVSLTVKGPGYETPFGPSVADNTFLDVKVEVVEFGQVNQESTIE